MNNLHKCAGCLWEGECVGTTYYGLSECEFYSPADDNNLLDYELDLQLRVLDYQEMIGEYNDDD